MHIHSLCCIMIHCTSCSLRAPNSLAHRVVGIGSKLLLAQGTSAGFGGGSGSAVIGGTRGSWLSSSR